MAFSAALLLALAASAAAPARLPALGPGLRLERPASVWRPTSFHATLDGAPVFVKLASDREVLALQKAASVPLPAAVSVPAPVAAGAPGIPELGKLPGGHMVPADYRFKHAALGHRVLVTEAAPQGSRSLDEVLKRGEPLRREDWDALVEAAARLSDAGVSHADLGNAENVLVRRAGEAARFLIIDWERAWVAGDHDFAARKREPLAELERHGRALRRAGLLVD